MFAIPSRKWANSSSLGTLRDLILALSRVLRDIFSRSICLLLVAVFLGSSVQASVHVERQASTALQGPPQVLVLYSDERLLPANIVADEAIRATFAASAAGPIEFHSEFLDPTRFPGQEQELRQRDFLREKYRERPPAVVIARCA